jgi:hypothetical protein
LLLIPKEKEIIFVSKQIYSSLDCIKTAGSPEVTTPFHIIMEVVWIRLNERMRI